jgi:hypothetical protein
LVIYRGAYFAQPAGVVELADTLALGASAERRGGSSPLPGTIKENHDGFLFLCSLARSHLSVQNLIVLKKSLC